MGIDPSSQIPQFLNINLPKTEPIVFDAAIARKLPNRIARFWLHAHTYSLTHNLKHGSLEPNNALEFACQHELHGLIYKWIMGETKPQVICFALEQEEIFIKCLLAELRWLATLFLEN